jgi:SAM-dependent methyltransferase
MFGVPEEELQALGDVRGLRVVELGCGTAYVSATLARAGASVVGVDLSEAQLATARRCQELIGPRFSLVQGDGEAVPLRSGWSDVVVSEHGVGVWCDPDRWVPEAARLLRPGGVLVVLVNSLLSALCVPDGAGPAGERLLRGQHDVRRIHWSGGGLENHLSHGEWIATLRSHGFVVEGLHELFPPEGAEDPDYYGIVSTEWARRWPAEEMWIARRTS